MKPNWKTIKLSDVIQTNIATYSSNDEWEFVNYLDTGNIVTNVIASIQRIELAQGEKLPSRARRKVEIGDIIYSTVRPNQLHYGFVDNTPDNFLVSTGFAVLHPKKDKIDGKFLYYLLIQDEITEKLQAIAEQSTSAYPAIKPSDIEDLDFTIPDISEQKKISSILSAIDKKIELNAQINHNLLKEALTLYAAHFASQDKNGCIGDYCSVRSGFAFKSSWWVDKGVKVIKIGSISQDNLNLLECSHVDEDKIEKASDFKVGAGDLLIAMTGATIGKFTMVPHCSETLLVNQRVGKFFLGNNPVEKLPFIYCTLKQPDIYNEIVNRGQGSAQPNISAIDIMNIPCVIPSIDNLTTFNNTCQPLFDLIISNQRESQQLSEIRDSLLPKLMSGEIDVSEVEV